MNLFNRESPSDKRLDDLEARLIRVESRLVQLMNHFGIKPHGALPTKKEKKDDQR